MSSFCSAGGEAAGAGGATCNNPTCPTDHPAAGRFPRTVQGLPQHGRERGTLLLHTDATMGTAEEKMDAAPGVSA